MPGRRNRAAQRAVAKAPGDGRCPRAAGSRRRPFIRGASLYLCASVVMSGLLAGCTRDLRYQPLGMWNGSRLKPMEASPLDGYPSTARPAARGSVARDELQKDDPILTGRSGGKPVTQSPVPVTKALLERGQERYNVYCSPCHSRLGDGQGMAVQRSFPHPPDYAIPRLKKAALGHFFEVISNGYGVMYSYAQAVPPPDRWAIASYIRVLQEARPEVKDDPYLQERERARLLTIPEHGRPTMVPPAEGEDGDAAPGATPPGAAAPGGGH